MTVSELILELKKMPQDTPVLIRQLEGDNIGLDISGVEESYCELADELCVVIYSD